MSNVLITGGAGYIGSHTAVSLRDAGYTPVILDDFSNSHPKVIQRLEEILGESITYFEGDCCYLPTVLDIFREVPLTGVIHFAASKAVGESVERPIKYYANNINSLLTIIRAMTEFEVSHLVFSSSCTVYGQPDRLPVTENTPSQPAESPYGNTKQIGEEIIRDVTLSPHPLKAVSLRYFNPIGAHPSAGIGELPLGTPNNLVPFITQTAAGIRDELTIFGNDYHTTDGTCIRDYIHVQDLAEAHVKALQFLESCEQSNIYEVFNIGTGSGNSVMEIINTFQKATGESVNYKIGPRRKGDIEQIYANVEKARKVLGWEASHTLDEALAHAWNWQQSILSNHE